MLLKIFEKICFTLRFVIECISFVNMSTFFQGECPHLRQKHYIHTNQNRETLRTRYLQLREMKKDPGE